MISALKQSLFYILLILVILLYIDAKSGSPLKKNKKFVIIAHRGASEIAPENTFAAFDKAIEMNCDYIELDVQMNQDGELIVIHDTTLDRTTNASGPVKHVTNNALKYIDAGGWFDRSFKNERIPKLRDVLKRYSGKVGLLMELKNPSLYPGIEKQLAKLLKRYLAFQTKEAPYIVQSFDHQSIQKFHELLPSVAIGVLLGFTSGTGALDIQTFSSYANYLNTHFLLIDDHLINTAQYFGMEIIAWTVNEPYTAEKLHDMGVGGIVTNRPHLFG